MSVARQRVSRPYGESFRKELEKETGEAQRAYKTKIRRSILDI